jgi:hypothetical protein
MSKHPLHDDYYVARREHAFRLRVLGASNAESAQRLGVCPGRVQQMIEKFVRNMRKQGYVEEYGTPLYSYGWQSEGAKVLQRYLSGKII